MHYNIRRAIYTTMAIISMSAANAAEPTTVNHPAWADNAVIYEANVRQYTPQGTFTAFQQQLPRLKELGADIIWFMPIHPISQENRKGELGSYYAVADYKGVNPEFGSIDDFRATVKKAHDLGMKVIIDWVPNHTGCDNAWVKDHPERYQRDKDGKMYGPFDWTDVYRLDYSKPETRAAMIDAMAFWLREADIDGFRCDVAGMVPVEFWNEARPALEAVKPGIFMLAEATEPFLMEHAFDMDYNWPMKDLFNAIAATSGQYTFVAEGETEPHKLPEKYAVDILDLVAKQNDEYPQGSILMNMVTNHDLNSWEGTEFKRYGNLADAMAVLEFTLPGMPLIYTGQETGMDRAFEFFKKDTPPEWEPNSYFAFYQKLADLKHQRAELNVGVDAAPLTPIATGSKNVVAFARIAPNGNSTIVAANLGTKVEKLKIKSKLNKATDYMTGQAVKSWPKSLAPGEYFIYTTGD